MRWRPSCCRYGGVWRGVVQMCGVGEGWRGESQLWCICHIRSPSFTCLLRVCYLFAPLRSMPRNGWPNAAVCTVPPALPLSSIMGTGQG